MAISKQQLINWIPKQHKALFSDEDLYLLISNDLSFEETNAGIIVSQNGKEIRNEKTYNPVLPEEAIKSYFQQRKWLSATGNESEGTNHIKTLSQFEDKWIKDNPGKNMVSPEFDNALQDHTNKIENFDWHG
ncbi:hypothetical protein QWZ08_24990 [Ferruginibacter paludis]|uniref:hypothetical protein n=1 Tax=Ferruginibacter paludis TaxID=1310417 RepID=UPI0025B58FD2|nr:hypothetical protein [Ferruginibacter paludis]MDN3658924.1 hypothetical protein [Ferruginibacter paludis]